MNKVVSVVDERGCRVFFVGVLGYYYKTHLLFFPTIQRLRVIGNFACNFLSSLRVLFLHAWLFLYVVIVFINFQWFVLCLLWCSFLFFLCF